MKTKKEIFNEFVRDLKNYLFNRFDIIVNVVDRCCADDIGRATFDFRKNRDIENDIFTIEFFYDFDNDPDYPDRDYFVTVRTAVNRYDFLTFEDAFNHIKNMFNN